MAEYSKVYKEHIPALRFAGKRYTNADRQDGGYGHLWGEWFAKGWFAILEELDAAVGTDNGYLGFMRCKEEDFDNTFEYWIGMFVAPDAAIPEGFAYIDMPESDLAVAWIQGPDDGGLYAAEDECMPHFEAHGMGKWYQDAKGRGYFFERYNCPRYTTPDEQGNVILDYCAYLA